MQIIYKFSDVFESDNKSYPYYRLVYSDEKGYPHIEKASYNVFSSCNVGDTFDVPCFDKKGKLIALVSSRKD